MTFWHPTLAERLKKYCPDVLKLTSEQVDHLLNHAAQGMSEIRKDWTAWEQNPNKETFDKAQPNFYTKEFDGRYDEVSGLPYKKDHFRMYESTNGDILQLDWQVDWASGPALSGIYPAFKKVGEHYTLTLQVNPKGHSGDYGCWTTRTTIYKKEGSLDELKAVLKEAINENLPEQ